MSRRARDPARDASQPPWERTRRKQALTRSSERGKAKAVLRGIYSLVMRSSVQAVTETTALPVGRLTGVYERRGRFETHSCYEGRLVYVGSFRRRCDGAKARDLAILASSPPVQLRYKLYFEQWQYTDTDVAAMRALCERLPLDSCRVVASLVRACAAFRADGGAPVGDATVGEAASGDGYEGERASRLGDEKSKCSAQSILEGGCGGRETAPGCSKRRPQQLVNREFEKLHCQPHKRARVG